MILLLLEPLLSEQLDVNIMQLVYQILSNSMNTLQLILYCTEYCGGIRG